MNEKPIEVIEELRANLRSMITPWIHDSSHPPNFIRETGMGFELARVQTHSRFHCAHKPPLIGWRVQLASQGRFDQGVVMVEDPNDKESVQAAIAEAKNQADQALMDLLAGGRGK